MKNARILLFVLFLSASPLPAKTRAFEIEVQVDNLSAKTAAIITRKYGRRPFAGFNDFVFAVYQGSRSLFNRKQYNAMAEFLANRRVDPQERFIVHRLLGVYARLKYGGEARRMLAELVAIETIEQAGVEQHKNINFIRFQKKIRKAAKRFGLEYRNVDGRVYEVSLRNTGKFSGQRIGLHAHADVLPAIPEDWVLADGTQLDPFNLTQIGERWYGRGTQDDKNAIVTALFAMRIIKEERFKLHNEFKLLIDTAKLTSASAMPYYLARNSAPKYNIVLDGKYPFVTANKKTAKDQYPKRRWLKTLAVIASENLGLKKMGTLGRIEKPVYKMPNQVVFGLSRSLERRLDQHGNYRSKEFKDIDSFLLDMQIITEMTVRLGQMKGLDYIESPN